MSGGFGYRDKTLAREELAALSVSPDSYEPLVEFLARMYEWNERKNLTRVKPAEAWTRHILDSLVLVPLMEGAKHLLDIGTGPGLPAFPVAMARPEVAVTGLDSNAKMLEFLASVPLPNLRIVQARAEERTAIGTFDLVTGRALAPLPIQLEISARYLNRTGRLLPLRSGQEDVAASEPAARRLNLALQTVHEVAIPGSEIIRRIPCYRRTGPVPAGYPRRWSEIKAKPLA